ncbi:MAG: GNAT family N-acetyltransferase [Spirochaetia bacterium]|jgi:GNAT superfamily N-acetyltransferase/two-component sensor histidine kinase|nr:GNAT family N-acetyltransferase [Spirochaetia bacterium]
MFEESIIPLTPELEKMIRKNPLLNIDTFIIPSPYINDLAVEKDYSFSFVCLVEGEILGYMLVYSDKIKQNFHIYKLVTSPFGRNMGIGTAFIEHLAKKISDNSGVYLYIWEKHTDIIEFFKNNGFTIGEQIVYKNLVYYYFSAERSKILEPKADRSEIRQPGIEEIGKTRHDARKTLRLLSHMVESISIDNCNKIVEDINRETTSLINMINSFRDSTQTRHDVNLRDLILERIVPFVKASPVFARVQLNLNSDSPIISGYYINISRALINLISNSLDAIDETDRKGFIAISINENKNRIKLLIKDNGSGIDEEKLLPGEDGLPLFVGKTTKRHKTGEGTGTRQIYSTFGHENISVQSKKGKGTTWIITFDKSHTGSDMIYVVMERRFNEFMRLLGYYKINRSSERSRMIVYIWNLRKMEIFLYDLIMLFSNYHNIRTIYKTVFAFLMDVLSEEQLTNTISAYRSDYEKTKKWLYEIVLVVKEKYKTIRENVDTDKFKGALFKSYGIGLENNIIFTLDPETGNFFATDRKLAEHLDFVSYLGKEKNLLLRGEFRGDLNNENSAIFLGVWSIDSEDDLIEKLKLIRKGAQTLLKMGIHTSKKLSLYQTTYVKSKSDIDTYQTTTIKSFADMDDTGLTRFIRPADDEFQDYVFAVD